MKAFSMTVLALFGFAAFAAADNVKFDRTQRPPVGPTPPVATPAVVKQTLSNGTDVYIVSRHQLPIVSATLFVRAGSGLDGARPGLSSMAAALLDDGTTKYSSLEFANAVNFIGANLSASAGVEQSTISLQTLSSHLEEALGLLGEMLVRPTFKPDEVERERKSRLQSLKQQRDVATITADQVFNRVVYGADHPYGHPTIGTSAAVETITRDEIAAYHDRYYRPNNAALVVVGDVTAATFPALLEKALAGWTAKPIPDDASAIPAKPSPAARAVYLIDKPGAAQSEIRIGHAGAARSSAPDYYALRVMNTMLGGQFSSRINLNLREQRGFTYGARSNLAFRRGAGPFTAGGGIFTAKSDSAITEFLRELSDIRGGRPASAKELDIAKGQLTLSWPRQLETNDAVAGVVADLVFFGLPTTEITDFMTRVEKVTAEDVSRVAKQYISPDNLAIVVVGDLAKIRPGIEALNLGTVQVLDAQGQPVTQ